MSQPDDRLVRRVVEAAAGRDSDGPCPEAEVLGLYTERVLEGDEHDHVEAHVAGCARCQAMVAAMVRSAPESEAPGEGVLAGGGLQRWWAGWRWLVPVTATAAVVMLAVWVGRGPSEQAAESARIQAGPAEGQRAPVTAEPAAQQPASGVVARSDRAASRALREEPTARAAEPAAAPSAPAVGALADTRQAAPPALGASEIRPGQAPLERRRDAERRDVPAEQFTTAAPPTPTSSPPVQPPAPPAPVAPAPAQEAIAVNPSPAAAAGAARDAGTAERNQAAAPQAMAKAGAPSLASAAEGRRMAELTGRVTYRTRQALPPGATIDVRLLDISRADAPAGELARTVIVTKGEQVPVPFAVPYDANAIDPRRRYTLQATITIAGRVAFRTTAAPAVLTSGAPATNVEVVVEPPR